MSIELVFTILAYAVISTFPAGIILIIIAIIKKITKKQKSRKYLWTGAALVIFFLLVLIACLITPDVRYDRLVGR